MGGGGPVITYTYSTATNVPTPSVVWFVIDPTSVVGYAGGWPPSNSGSVNLKIYIQPTKPTAADTPVHTEAVSATSFDSIGVMARGTPQMYWDKLEWTLEDYYAFRSADPGWKNCVVQHETGNNDSTAAAAYVATGVPYLGTDKVYETDEVT